MSDPGDFTACSRLADELIDKTTKQALADVARLLSLIIGWYHEKYGGVPQETLLKMVRVESLNEETQRLLLHGMPSLFPALAEVMGMDDDLVH